MGKIIKFTNSDKDDDDAEIECVSGVEPEEPKKIICNETNTRIIKTFRFNWSDDYVEDDDTKFSFEIEE